MYKAGDIFPSQEDRERIQKYEDYKSLFNNEQWKLFVERAQELRKQRKIKKRLYSDIEQLYISIPIVMELPKLVSDLLFRYSPIIDISDKNKAGQELATDIQKYNKLHIKLQESSVDCAAKGGIVAKTYLEAGNSIIEFLQPDKYFIHKDLRGKIDEHILSWTFKIDKPILGAKEYRYIETHKLNKETNTWWIYYQVFEIKGDKLNKQVNIKDFFPDLEDAEDTKLSTCSLIFIPYFRAMDNYFGYSIYHGLEGLFDELNSRVSLMSKLLDKYSDPTVTGPEIDEDEEDEEGIVRRGTTVREKYITRESNDVPDVNYVTWDGKIEGHIAYVKDLLFTILYICTPLNPSLYGLDTGTGQVSGKAIKLKSFRTDCTVDRWGNYFIDGIQQAIYNAMEYQRIWVDSTVKSEYPDIVIIKGFSRDLKEEADTEQVRITSGSTSVVSSIMRLDRCSKEKAEEEYKAILDEKKQETQSMKNTRKTLNLFGGDTGAQE